MHPSIRSKYAGFSTDEDDIIEMEFSHSSLSDGMSKGVRAHRMMTGERVLKKKLSPVAAHRRAAAAASVGHATAAESGRGAVNRFLDNVRVERGRAHFVVEKSQGHLNEEEFDIADLYEEITNHETAFTKVLATADMRELIEPFLNIEFDNEREMLGDEESMKKLKIREAFMRAKTLHETDDELESLSAEERFSRIGRDLQIVLQRFVNSDFVTKIENVMIDFCQHREDDAAIAALPLVVIIPDGYLRMICHGVAQYYSLFTRSVDFNGDRVTLISKPRIYRFPRINMPPLNCIHLSEFITKHFSTGNVAIKSVEKSQEEYFSVVQSAAHRQKICDCVRTQGMEHKKQYRKRRERQMHKGRRRAKFRE